MTDRNMIEVTFSEQSFDKCSWGSDEMGEYFGYQLKWEHNFYFWYPKYEAVFNRWEQKIKDIPKHPMAIIIGLKNVINTIKLIGFIKFTD